MDTKLQLKILSEAEKLYGFGQIINIIVKTSSIGVMYAVSFMDGYGMPTERQTGWHSNPVKLLETLEHQNMIKDLRNKR